jgi:SAM-dependent methyltransferase
MAWQLCKILLLNIKTTYFRIFEWLRVALRYYPREWGFVWIDLLLAVQYLWKNPHRISKAFLRAQGAKNSYGFGETPLTTLDHIAKKCRILSHDFVYELGCGSGRTCFWLQTFVGCQVVGVDYLPAFIKKANRVKRLSSSNKIHFIQEDMLQVNLRKATVIYLYGTCLEEQVIERLVGHFRQVRPLAKVITVSYSLAEYDSTLFRVSQHFAARFPWGKADIYLNERL